MKLSRHLRTLIAHTLCLCLLSGFILGSTIVAEAAPIGSAGSGGAAYPVPPEIESGNCILIDADTGIVLYEKNSDEKCYPASVTKLMTALLVVENCNLNDTLTVSANAVSSVKYGDASAGLKKDEEFTVEQALNIMLIKSANDMAYALGEHVGGSIANFANMMNKRAEELGCTGTHFSNASGLTDINHYTTARDMALICRAVINSPTIMNAISYTKSYSVPPTNKTADTRYYRLSHSMVTGKYLYEYCLGGKTGYTDAAGHTLATFAGKDGLRLICVVFNSTDEQRYIDTTALFEYAFNNFHRMNIAQNEDTFSFNQGLGLSAFGVNGKALSGGSNITLSVPDSDYVLVPHGLSFSELTKEIVFNNNVPSDDDNEENSSAGSSSGAAGDTTFAEIDYYYDGHLLGHTNLIFSERLSDDASSDSVSVTGLPYLIDTDDGSTDMSSLLQEGHFFTVNIWLCVIVLCVIILALIILINVKKNRHNLRFS